MDFSDGKTTRIPNDRRADLLLALSHRPHLDGCEADNGVSNLGFRNDYNRGIRLKTSTTSATAQSLQEPPRPFRFSYEAGRAPGGKPDRYVEQEGDGSGQIKGSYTYLDPNWTWQTVPSSIGGHTGQAY